MSVLVWVMVAIAFWHLAVLVPDRFWGGIVGAFLAPSVAGCSRASFCRRRVFRRQIHPASQRRCGRSRGRSVPWSPATFMGRARTRPRGSSGLDARLGLRTAKLNVAVASASLASLPAVPPAFEELGSAAVEPLIPADSALLGTRASSSPVARASSALAQHDASHRAERVD